MDYQFVAIAPTYWGAGQTVKEAKSRLRQAGFKKKTGFVVLELEPPSDIEVNEVHGPCFRHGTKQILVEDYRKGRQQHV